MKLAKRLCALSAAAVMSLSVCTPVFAEDAAAAKIQVNGKISEIEATITDDKAYVTAEEAAEIFGGEYADEVVAVRDAAEALGYMIGWDDDEKTVIIVDIDSMAAERGATFEILKKYAEYSASLGDTIKSTGTFSGGIDITDEGETLSVPFSGTVESVSGNEGETASVNLVIDLSQYLAEMGAEEMDETEQYFFNEIMAAITSSDSKVIYDAENSVIYMNSTLFTIFGSDENTWIEMDMSDLTEGLDMDSIMNIAESGDIDALLLETLKAMPVDSVDSYDDMVEAYDIYASMLGDDSFTLEDGQYKSSFAMNDDGTELTYVMTFGTDGDAVNSCTITMKIADDTATMDMSVASDKDMNIEMSFSMSLADMIKVYFEMKSEAAATDEAVDLSLPDDAYVISMDSTMGALFGTADEEIEAAVEIAE